MVDLHIHSIYSDGALGISEIVELCSKKGIDIISICDHNTIAGLDDLANEKICFINGVEFYAQRINTKEFHILGYDFDKDNPNFIRLLEDLELKRIECMRKKLKAIQEKFLIDLDIETFSKSRMNDYDIILSLKDRESKEKIKEILEYVRSLKLKPDRKINPRVIIDTIREANGIPVLAHPGRIKCDDFDTLIKEVVDAGIMGIELYHSSHTKEDIERLKGVINKYNLITSGGSDYHGYYIKDLYGNDVELGESNLGNMISENQVSILKKVRKM
jgi:predicted metal-dependent phosphoesterase TrpH